MSQWRLLATFLCSLPLWRKGGSEKRTATLGTSDSSLERKGVQPDFVTPAWPMMGMERNEAEGVQDPFLTGHMLWVVVLGQCPPSCFSSCYFEAKTMAKEVVGVMSMCSGSSSPKGKKLIWRREMGREAKNSHVLSTFHVPHILHLIPI